jgi:hypothetical protein
VLRAGNPGASTNHFSGNAGSAENADIAGNGLSFRNPHSAIDRF